MSVNPACPTPSAKETFTKSNPLPVMRAIRRVESVHFHPLKLTSAGKMGKVLWMLQQSRRLTMVTLVWLTAGSLALASMPRIDCVCPNGKTKIFCLSSIFGSKDCCSTGCPGNERGPGKGCCCCYGACDSEVSATANCGPNSDGGCSVHRGGCTKIFVAPHFTSLDPSQDLDAGNQASETIVALIDSEFAIQRANEIDQDFDAFPVTRPPTASLIILLQHFRN